MQRRERNLAQLRSGAYKRSLTREQFELADNLYYEYCARPQHRDRLTKCLRASLRAAANRVARHGNPPGYNARLAYRMHKKRRARALALAIYGDPSATCSLDVMLGPIAPSTDPSTDR